MTSFVLNSPKVPAEDAFWYRMALLDVQQALIDSAAEMDRDTVDAIFYGIRSRYDQLWEQRKPAQNAV